MGFIKMRDGILLNYQKDLAKNPKGVILINHGFAEHLGRYDYVTKRLVDSGYNVYRYDLRGHGRSKSRLGHIEYFNDFIEDCDEMVELMIKENSGLPLFMLGHSMGGLITALYGVCYNDKLQGQIFSGAALGTLPSVARVKKILPIATKFFRNVKVKNPIDDSLCGDREVFSAYLNDPLVLRKATMNFYVEFLINSIKIFNERVKEYNYPCLITHGKLDKIVPKELSISFFNSISSKDKEIKIYDGLYHEILNEKIKDHILNDMILWLDRELINNY
ncbi:alpha/beta hydrolase [Tissierella sp. Yu-01]|uniref:alpha/beta hydrolase n=1 Tax=Tissierella sp. Yu-01 TaxID=3035694 RepID=UPI00240E03FC|nr:alpha/beta hydrolase [Tissierella sp. Yu-01]WFA09412.1 lysophospholipase [Tissierella sp. Yu-01]